MYVVMLLEDQMVSDVYIAKDLGGVLAILVKYKGEQGKLYYRAWVDPSIPADVLMQYKKEYDRTYGFINSIRIRLLVDTTIYSKEDLFDELL